MNRSLPSPLLQRVFALLERMRRLRRGHSGRPALTDLDTSAGHARGHLRRQLKGEIRMPAEDLFRVFELFGAAPEEVLAAARRGLAPLDLWLGETAKAHAGQLRRLRQARQAAAEPAPPDLAAALDKLSTLQRTGLHHAEGMGPYLAALTALEDEADPEAEALCFRTWDLLGTAYRAAAEYSAAAYCYRQALHVAGHQPESRAHLLRRASYLASDDCDFDHALFFTDQAQEIYRRLFRPADLGRAWIDSGVVLYKSERYETAATSYQAGLRLIGHDFYYQFTAEQGTGLCHVARGRIPEARQSLIRAQAVFRSMGSGSRQEVGLHWLAAEVAVAENDYLTAKILYQQIRSIYAEAGNTLDYALASLRLARTLLLLGDPENLERLAIETTQLLSSLSRYRLATAILRDFYKYHAAGQLTTSILDRLFTELKERGRVTGDASRQNHP